jgi:uncharacterized zinc-type alcohol dehydrogenase-like protein
MVPSVNAYGAVSATEPLTAMTIERRELRPRDVLIEIRFTGVCHSDLHYIRDEWGLASYPAVPGHEIVGIVTEVGEAVRRHAVGDRVGVGCLVDSCRECVNCRGGEEQYCVRGGGTLTFGSIDSDGALTQGGYSTHIVVTEDFVLAIPDRLDLAASAPLLCAGITTYSLLRRWRVGPGKKVAIVGFGGTGHIAVKLAKAMGAEVTVLSQSGEKRADALRMGADHYHATSDPDTFKHLAGSVELMVNTVSDKIDLDACLGLLVAHGTLVNVGLSGQPLEMNAFSLLMGGRSVAGSLIGGLAQTQEMLEFCATHDIGAEVEVIPADQINEAYARMLAADVRYRFVIDVSTLD